MNGDRKSRLPRKRGVLLGVFMPMALLATIPDIGVANDALCCLRFDGLPAADGVPCRKSGFVSPASECRGVPTKPGLALAMSSISTSSEEGSSARGGEDMVRAGGKRRLTRRVTVVTLQCRAAD